MAPFVPDLGLDEMPEVEPVPPLLPPEEPPDDEVPPPLLAEEAPPDDEPPDEELPAILGVQSWRTRLLEEGITSGFK